MVVAKVVLYVVLVAAAHGSSLHGGHSSFSYGVSDPHTGDIKGQHETRIGDSVVGQYSLLDSDGTKRTVDYAADAHSGFNAVVRKEPSLVHTPVVAHDAPVVAPVAQASRLAYGAQVASLAYNTHVSPLAYGAHATPFSYAAVSPLAYDSNANPLAHGYGVLNDGLRDHGYGVGW